MRSLSLKHSLAAGAALALAGCLVSEEPILDEQNGKATPLAEGAHLMCPLSDDADENDCERFTVSVDQTGLYAFKNAAIPEDDAHLRFRRVARNAYVVQAYEDDGALFYFGQGDEKSFVLTLIMCGALIEQSRSRLIESGDLAVEDDDFSVCEVKSLKGLTAVARDYHHGRFVKTEDNVSIEITPVVI